MESSAGRLLAFSLLFILLLNHVNAHYPPRDHIALRAERSAFNVNCLRGEGEERGKARFRSRSSRRRRRSHSHRRWGWGYGGGWGPRYGGFGWGGMPFWGTPIFWG